MSYFRLGQTNPIQTSVTSDVEIAQDPANTNIVQTNVTDSDSVTPTMPPGYNKLKKENQTWIAFSNILPAVVYLGGKWIPLIEVTDKKVDKSEELIKYLNYKQVLQTETDKKNFTLAVAGLGLLAVLLLIK